MKIKKNKFVIRVYRNLYFFYYRFLSSFKFSSHYIQGGVIVSNVSEEISFFGYYNVCPDNLNGDVIFLKVGSEEVRGSINHEAYICIKNSIGEEKVLTSTKSYNWQQGCMLNWIGSNRIIFNDFDQFGNSYVSKIFSCESGLIKVLDLPVYSVYSDQFALCLNFDRLAKCRPDYGYFNRSTIELPDFNNDGIWSLDLDSGKYRLILKLNSLVYFDGGLNPEFYNYRVNHIDISPDGELFVFIFRYDFKGKRFSKLFVSDVSGNELRKLAGDDMVSHFCWMNNTEILVYCTIDSKTDYYLIDVLSGSARLFSENFLKVDGHPSLSPCKKFLVVDTYPDRDRFSKLYIFDLEKELLLKVGEFYQPIRYTKEFRVDLHPKWSNRGEKVYFESGHLGKRQLFVADIRNML